MSASGLGLGRVFNVVMVADGLDIPLTRGQSVAFVAFVAAGDQALTVEESDSTGTNATQVLDVGLNPWISPGVGGTWSAGPAASSGVVTNADATNDCLHVSVHASQLSDGYDEVQCTVTAGGGAVTAIVYDLTVQRTPANLASNLVA